MPKDAAPSKSKSTAKASPPAHEERELSGANRTLEQLNVVVHQIAEAAETLTMVLSVS
jgi:hypothetical protein